MLTASWPKAASATSKISSGMMLSFNRLISETRSVSICKRPAVSKIKQLAPWAFVSAMPFFAILVTSFSSRSE